MFGKKFFAVLTALCIGGTLLAGNSWFSHGSKRRPVTLIVTGNYKSPRLMAELIMNESRQPYLLISGERYFVVLPKSPAIEIPNGKLNEFVRTLGPRRLVILGNEQYVSANFPELLDQVIPVVRIQAREWNSVARELDELLNLGRLEKNYRALREQLDNDELNRPMRMPESAKLTVPVMTPIPAAAEEQAPAEEKAPAPVAEAEKAPAAETAPAPAAK